MLSHAKLNSLYIYLLYGLAFLIPSGFYNFEGLVIALLLIVWIFTKQYKVVTRESAISLFLLSPFFLLYLVSLVYTSDVSNGVDQMTKHLSYLLIPLIFTTSLIDQKKIKCIALVFLFSTVLFLFIADIYAIADIIKTGSYIIRVGNGDYYKFLSYGLTRVFSEWHPTLVSLFLMFSLAITVKYLFKSKKRYAIPLIIFIILNIFLIKSIIGIFCLIFIASAFLVSLIEKNSYRVMLIISVLTLVSIFYLINPFRIDKIQQFKKTKIEITDNEDRRNVLSIRLVKWSSALNLFKENPIYGVAPGDLRQNMVDEYKKADFEFAATNRFGPHNQYLQILAAFGIIGFLWFLAVLFFPFLFSIEIHSLYGWFLLITLLFFLTEDVLERQQGLVFFSFFYALLLSQSKKA